MAQLAQSAPSKARLPELDGLRGIAISLVLVYHYFYFVPAPARHSSQWSVRVLAAVDHFGALGWSGVDLFFVLSGFLIGGILLDAQGSPNYFKTFYARRVFRILPIYYVWIGAYLLVMTIAGRFLLTHIPGGIGGWETGTAVAAQVFFLQNFRLLPYASGISRVWFQPTWSLAIEEQFYLISPAVIRLLTRSRIYLFLSCVILSAPFLRWYVRDHWQIHNPDVLGPAYTLMPCRADELALGILTALLWRNRSFRDWLGEHGRSLYLAVAALFAGVTALCVWAPRPDLFVEQIGGYTWIAIFYALVVLLVLSNPAGWLGRLTRIGWLRELGKVSYCVYLIHVAVGTFFEALMAGVLKRPLVTWAVVVPVNIGAVVLTYAIARASWVYLENPLLQKGHQYKY
jgi:peptidoglycan/LPS O-acetylase OafA/YrhL